MKSSIFKKNLFINISLLLLCLVLVGGVFTAWSYRYIITSEHDNLSLAAENASRTTAALAQTYDLDSMEMKMNISVLGEATGYRLMVTDSDGIVCDCSEGLFCSHIGLSLPEEMIESANSSGSYNGVFTSTDTRYVIVVPLNDTKEQHIGYVLASANPSELAKDWRALAGRMFMVAVVVLIITVIVSWLATLHTTRPIHEITDTVDRFARGDYSARAEVSSDDELGKLADSFNLMADTLERQEKQRSEFIANVSHELKTPMTTISGFADGILDGTIPREKEQEYLAVISNETHRLSRLVRNMLNVSSMSAKDPEVIRSKSFDLTELIVQTMLSLEGKINDKGLDVDADFPEESIHALGDRDSITQVVYNLLDNAVKFADKDSVLKVSLWKQSGRAYVAISDHGQTIPSDDLPLIFDRFHKSDKSRSVDKDGVGLGLYLVKTILDNHREDIFVTSENGLTTFTFTLTIAPQK